MQEGVALDVLLSCGSETSPGWRDILAALGRAGAVYQGKVRELSICIISPYSVSMSYPLYPVELTAFNDLQESFSIIYDPRL